MGVNYWAKFDFGGYYHLYNRSANHESIFHNAEDCTFFLSKITILLYPYCSIYAYCVMHNHFHLINKVHEKEKIILQAETESTKKADKFLRGIETLNDLLGDQLRRLFSSYGLRYNHKYSKNGPVFAPRSKRIFIENNDRLRYLITYVHHNPIHHQASNDYSSWKFSSFNVFNSAKITHIARNEVLKLFGNYQAFRLFHQQFRIEKTEVEID